MRWHPICWNSYIEAPHACTDGPQAFAFDFLWDGLLMPSAFYLLWQVAYLLCTEWILGDFIRDDPDMQTSLKWLSTDPRSSIYKIASGTCVKLGVMVPGEVLDPARWKTKLIFVVSQLVYTMIVLLPVKVLHSSYILHTLWLC